MWLFLLLELVKHQLERPLLEVPPEVIVEPEQSSGQTDIRKKTSMLEVVNMNKVIRIHLIEGDFHFAKEFLEDFEQRDQKSAFKGGLRHPYGTISKSQRNRTCVVNSVGWSGHI